MTIGVLCAVSTALAAHLRELGDDPSTLGAEVPMAKATVREAHNHFGNVGIGLYPELKPAERAARIADDLADRRQARRTSRDARGQAGLSLPCLRRCCAGAWRSSTRLCGRPP